MMTEEERASASTLTFNVYVTRYARRFLADYVLIQ
jgi:hypothetical protein